MNNNAYLCSRYETDFIPFITLGGNDRLPQKEHGRTDERN